jgi:hypothetical protein
MRPHRLGLATLVLAGLLSFGGLGFAQAPTSNWFDGVVDWIVDVLPIGPGPYEPSPPSNPSGPGTDVNSVADCDVIRGTQGGTEQTGLQSWALNDISAGQVLCLRGGSYKETDGVVDITNSGTVTNYKVVASYPGETAEVRGAFRFPSTGNYWQLGPNLVVHGHYGAVSTGSGNVQNCPTSNPTCPRVHTMETINVQNSQIGFILRDSEITNRDPAWKTGPYTDSNGDSMPDIFEREGSCFHGGGGAGAAQDIQLVRNVFHRCGELTPDNYYTTDADTLPDRNNLEHCVYTGVVDNLVLRDNVLYGCANRGVNFFPDTNNSIVENNIIDSGNTGIAPSGGCTNNIIRNNVITNSTPVNNECAAGSTTIENNVVCADTGGACGTAPTGTGNIAANPQFANNSEKTQSEVDHDLSQVDYTIQNSTAAAKYGGTYAGGKAD